MIVVARIFFHPDTADVQLWEYNSRFRPLSRTRAVQDLDLSDLSLVYKKKRSQ